MMYVWIAISGLFLCSLSAFAVSVRAAARVAKFEKSITDLDWEAVAKITGDIGSVKRSILQVNNRINGMESSKGGQAAALAAAQELQLRSQQQRMGSNVSILGG
jgi:hypothetical protein